MNSKTKFSVKSLIGEMSLNTSRSPFFKTTGRTLFVLLSGWEFQGPRECGRSITPLTLAYLDGIGHAFHSLGGKSPPAALKKELFTLTRLFYPDFRKLIPGRRADIRMQVTILSRLSTFVNKRDIFDV
jgi:hypothetical protein